MRRASPIALVLLGCAACVHHDLRERIPDSPSRAGVPIRLLLSGGAGGRDPLAARFLDEAVAETLVRLDERGHPVPSLASSWRRNGMTWTFALDSSARFPDGSAVTAEDVIAAWSARTRVAGGAAARLLAPVAGLDGNGQELSITMTEPLEDVPERLARRALGVDRPLPGGKGREGSGPFLYDATQERLLANPYHSPAARSEAISLLSDSEVDPELLLRLGEADVALVWGPDARGEAAGPGEPRAARVPSYDRIYALALNPRARWTADPVFRRWVGRAVDRESILLHVFAGGGEVPASLTGVPAVVPASTGRPFTGRPRLVLLHDRADRTAGLLASRIVAALGASGVEVVPEAVPVSAFAGRLAPGGAQLALVLDAQADSDPALALDATLATLGPLAADAREVLAGAAVTGDPVLRTEQARLAERALLDDARLVPLVRVWAWLRFREEVAGVEPEPGRGPDPGSWRLR